MGYWKERAIEMDERQYGDAFDKYICAECVGDEYLKNWIIENADTEIECSYCGELTQCVSMETFVGKIMEAIRQYYSTVGDEAVIYDKEDDVYVVPTIDTYDLIDDINNDLMVSDDIADDLKKIIYDEIWCKKDPYSSTLREIEISSWRYFEKLVKESNRYFFLNICDDAENEYLSPRSILDTIHEYSIKLGLIKTLPVNQQFFRSRSYENETNINICAEELCSPPHKLAKANRMSAVGISVFYASDNEEVAKNEVINKDSKYVVTARFKNLQEIKYLDISAIKNIAIPSLFDIDKYHERETILFLNELNRYLTKDISEDEDIEYVPTQVFSEYFRIVGKLNGIKYDSNKCKNGSCFVLFYNHEDCVKTDKRFSLLEPKMEYIDAKKEHI